MEQSEYNSSTSEDEIFQTQDDKSDKKKRKIKKCSNIRQAYGCPKSIKSFCKKRNFRLEDQLPENSKKKLFKRKMVIIRSWITFTMLSYSIF